jgi:hypothetical protein
MAFAAAKARHDDAGSRRGFAKLGNAGHLAFAGRLFGRMLKRR